MTNNEPSNKFLSTLSVILAGIAVLGVFDILTRINSTTAKQAIIQDPQSPPAEVKSPAHPVKPSNPNINRDAPNPTASPLSGSSVKAVHHTVNKVVTVFGMIQNTTETVKRLADLDDGKDPIYMLIDSPGGSVMDGNMVLSQMESMKTPVFTVCTRLCASMAAVILEHGAKRLAVNRSVVMFHPASGSAEGQINNMLSLLHLFKRGTDKVDNFIVARSKMSKEEFNALMAYELWLEADEALEKGLIDEIVHINFQNPEKAPLLQSRVRFEGVGSTKFDVRN